MHLDTRAVVQLLLLIGVGDEYARSLIAAFFDVKVLASNQYGQAVRESVVCVQTRALASLNNLLMAHDDEERIIIALAPSNVWALLVEIAANRPFGMLIGSPRMTPALGLAAAMS
jgi:hypothetical protein